MALCVLVRVSVPVINANEDEEKFFKEQKAFLNRLNCDDFFVKS